MSRYASVACVACLIMGLSVGYVMRRPTIEPRQQSGKNELSLQDELSQLNDEKMGKLETIAQRWRDAKEAGDDEEMTRCDREAELLCRYYAGRADAAYVHRGKQPPRSLKNN